MGMRSFVFGVALVLGTVVAVASLVYHFSTRWRHHELHISRRAMELITSKSAAELPAATVSSDSCLADYKANHYSVSKQTSSTFDPRHMIMIHEPEIELLCAYMNSPDLKMLEWGSGGSTFLLSKHTRSYTSIEHDIGWAGVIATAITALPAEHRDRMSYSQVPPEVKSWWKDGKWHEFATYVNWIDRLALANHTHAPWDRLLIDGRARVACGFVAYMHQHIKPDGKVFVHDWERAEYKPLLCLYQELHQTKSRLDHNEVGENSLGVMQPRAWGEVDWKSSRCIEMLAILGLPVHTPPPPPAPIPDMHAANAALNAVPGLRRTGLAHLGFPPLGAAAAQPAAQPASAQLPAVPGALPAPAASGSSPKR